ncbi:30S ribosomal protein S4 [Candidatus Peregrinibacteria bacterium]|nr:MAG: 30S ribosomal protein S4 [Candidatus Peregrinibacteria bacterium]
MSRYTGPKGRLVRRFGVDIFGTAKMTALLEKRPQGPGMHGGNRQGKASEYKKQLLEKQKMRLMYGLTEKQLRNYYLKATTKKEATGVALQKMLESRLDNVVYRAGFAKTRAQARQMVNHGMWTLNGRRVSIPSMQVHENDVIEVREKSKTSPLFTAVKEDKDFGSARWLKAEQKGLKIEVSSLPEQEDLDKIIDTQLIVEFYSK